MHLHRYDAAHIASLTKPRAGETKLGERVRTLSAGADWEAELQASPARFVLLGLPEDIGVRANLGRGGAQTAWEPALKAVLNVQSTELLSGEELLVLGHVDFADLMRAADGLETSKDEDLARLRELVAEVDARVVPIVQAIVRAGKRPIVIGGGHNNSYGCLKGAALGLAEAGQASQPVVNAINCDPHSDFRRLEGRHSGNGFSYAAQEGYLEDYAIVGMQENYNSQAVVAALKGDRRVHYSTFEDIFLRERLCWREAVAIAIGHTAEGWAGIELDMDAIAGMPASAKTPSGISANQARQFVSWCGAEARAAYLHLAEAAPALADSARDNSAEKLLAFLVTDFMKACR